MRSVTLKRIIDVALACCGVLVFLPVFVIVGAAVWIQLGRPVIFVQTRPGLGGRPFRMYKFRTMREAVDRAGQPLPDAERLTGLGRLLRRLSLDEIPEFVNVLKGDMSMVGPRPLLMEYLPLYSSRQLRRHDVRPGITGWAQVNGRNALTWQQKLDLDVWYVENRSLGLDLRVLLLTLLRVVRGDGVSQQGHATMEPFRGNE